MTVCTRLSDRMASVAHGREPWTSDEAAHLAGCADCRAEWGLMVRGVALGDEADRTLHPEFIASRVVAELRAGRRGVREWAARLRWLALPLAAAAVIVVARGGPPPGGEPLALAELGILPELGGLDEAELEQVLQALPSPQGTTDIRGFEELSEEEITMLLGNLEG